MVRNMVYVKFYYDWLRINKALGNFRKSDNNNENKIMFVRTQSLFNAITFLCPNSTRRARPDFVGDPGLRPGLRQSPFGSARVSDKFADFVWSDISEQSRHVRIFSVGPVGSQTKSVGPCSGIWKRHDTTRPRPGYVPDSVKRL